VLDHLAAARARLDTTQARPVRLRHLSVLQDRTVPPALLLPRPVPTARWTTIIAPAIITTAQQGQARLRSAQQGIIALLLRKVLSARLVSGHAMARLIAAPRHLDLEGGHASVFTAASAAVSPTLATMDDEARRLLWHDCIISVCLVV